MQQTRILLFFALILLFRIQYTQAQNQLSLSFDGNADRVIIASDPALDFSEGTVELWVKPNSYNYNGAMIAKRNSASTRFSFHLNPNSGLIGLWNGTNFLSKAGLSISAGEWTHIAFVISSSDVRLYIDGIDNGLLGGTIGSTTGLDLVLGSASNTGTVNEMFNGSMDEVRIWNVQRSQSDIENNYNSELVGDESGLIAYYNFNNSSATAEGTNTSETSLTDRSSNSFTGTLTDFALTGSTSNWVGQGCEVTNNCASEFSGGLGTPENPYQISTVEELQKIKDHLDKHFILINNIDASDTKNWNNGIGFTPIGSFSGSLDGQGFSVSGLVIDGSASPAPLFMATFIMSLNNGSYVKNIQFLNVDIKSKRRSSSAIANSNNGLISNVYVSGSIYSYGNGFNYIGGIASINNTTGVIRDVKFEGSVTGDLVKPEVGPPLQSYFAGGIIGSNSGKLVSSSFNGTASAGYQVGGLVSFNQVTGIIDSSFAIGSVFFDADGSGGAAGGGLASTNYGKIKNSWANVDIITPSANSIGGLVGSGNGTIENSYSKGNVSGASYVGGIIGNLSNNNSGFAARIDKSYAMGNVTGTGSDIGGLIGALINGSGGLKQDSAFIYESYFAGELSGNDIGGLIGNFSLVNFEGPPADSNFAINSFWDTERSGVARTIGNGTGKTTAEMKSISTYSTWDFDNTWNINGGYPYLGSGPAFTVITGNEGWRMLSAPVVETTYTELLDTLWTQGIPGADTEEGIPNVYTWNETSQSWESPENLSESVIPGKGFIVYVFDDHNFDENPDGFPKYIESTKTKFSGNGTLGISYTESDSTQLNGWNLLGNTYPRTINWDAVSGWTRTNMDASYYVWSDSANGGLGSYLSWNGNSGTLSNGKIAPWQGFWVKSNDSNPIISFTEEVKDQEAVFFKRTPSPQIKLKLSNGKYYSKTVLWFNDRAELGKDRFDAFKLQSLNAEFLSLGTKIGPNAIMDIQALPMSLTEQEIHLDIDGNNLSGEFELSFDNLSIPDNWSLVLQDREKEVSIDISDTKNYLFTLNQEPNKKVEPALIPATPIQAQSKSKDSPSRFVLIVSTVNILSNEDGFDIPTVVELKQNYPNPFNPSTTITYGLPENGAVTLEVFDLLGRKVATLLDAKEKTAGRYTITFDGSNLASGMYIYRLKTSENVQVKKLTLIK